MGLSGCDERVKLQEDYAKWIKLLKAGCKFHFMDKEMVRYRVNGISNGEMLSPSYVADCIRFDLYYRYPEWCEHSESYAVERLVEQQLETYKSYVAVAEDYARICDSTAYRIGVFVLKPYRFVKRLWGKLEK